MFWSQLKQIVCETLSQKKKKKKKKWQKRAWKSGSRSSRPWVQTPVLQKKKKLTVAQVVDCLLSKSEALSSNPSVTNNNNNNNIIWIILQIIKNDMWTFTIPSIAKTGIHLFQINEKTKTVKYRFSTTYKNYNFKTQSHCNVIVLYQIGTHQNTTLCSQSLFISTYINIWIY
jgi:hypothetical protein